MTSAYRPTLTIDAMAATVTIAEIVSASLLAQHEGFASIRLVGDAQKLEDAVRQRGANLSDLDIIHTDQFVGRRENGVRAMKIKKTTSLQLAANLSQTNGTPLIVFGNGNALREVTRQKLSMSGRLCPFAGQVRLAGRQVTILDVGPYVHTTGSQLVQFGLMGACFPSVSVGATNPTVGLLSGELSLSHCPDHLREAHLGLHERCGNYVGIVNSEQLSSNPPDVLVMDSQFGSIFRQRELHFQRDADSLGSRPQQRSWRDVFARGLKKGDVADHPPLESMVALGARSLVVYRPEAVSEHAVLSSIQDAANLDKLDVIGLIENQLETTGMQGHRTTTEHPSV